MPTHAVHRHGKGFTLIEMMVVVAIVAILAALAAPSFNDYIAKNRVKGAAEEIYGLILQAKSEGPIRDADISINVSTSAPWCVGYATAANCSCSGTISCTVDVAGTAVTQVVSGSDFTNVTLAESFAGTGTTFSLPRGNAAGGSITATSGNWALRVVISPQGRVILCNPNDNTMIGYEACPS